MDKLKPCPFCGGGVRMYPQVIGNIQTYYIAHIIPRKMGWCVLADQSIFRCNQKDHLIKYWNTRALKPLDASALSKTSGVGEHEKGELRVLIKDLYVEEKFLFDEPKDANWKYAQDCLKILIVERLAQALSLPNKSNEEIVEELFGLELETKEGEDFTLGHAIGKYCVKQIADFLDSHPPKQL